MKNKVLVYAFASWGKNNTNISEQILNQLDLPVDKIVLPVSFNKQVYSDILNKGYTHIIGLGQHNTGSLIRIEQIANNIYGSKSNGYQTIESRPTTLQVDLQLIPTSHSILTYDAGKFVCNYSMYTILREKRKDQQFAFLHIPKSINLYDATIHVEEILKQVV